jgi:tetratricopeptide (TPR) repeat protein
MATLRRDLIIGVLLAVATAAVYAPIVGHGFINYDDRGYVAENPHLVGGFTPHDISWAMTATRQANWHPLTWFSHLLDVRLFGLWAGGHHLVSLLMHVAGTVLLYVVLRRMTGAVWPSAVVAALFALHPLHVESVAWASERKDVLGGLFWMLTLWAYAWYAARPGPPRRVFDVARYALVFALLAVGLTAKPMLVTLPFVLLLLDFWPLKRLTWATAGRRILEKVPLVLLAAASSVVTYLVQKAGGAVASTVQVPMETRVANAVPAYATYIRKMFWPSDLSVFYPMPRQMPWVEVALAAVLLVGVTVLVLWQVRRRPYLAVGWFWFLGVLVPVIGLVRVGEQFMADRYSYLPFIGLFIMLAWGGAELAGRWRVAAKVLVPVAAAALLACAAVTVAQERYWTDDFALFGRAIALEPDNHVAHCQLGEAMEAKGRHDEAAGEFREALRLEPGDSQAHGNLAMVLFNKGLTAEALAHYREAVRINPRRAITQSSMGVALMRLGCAAEAVEHCRIAVRLEPEDAVSRLNLGTALAHNGRMAEAMVEYHEALRLRPDLAEAHNDFAAALLVAGRPGEAEAELRQALRLKPDLAQAHRNLGLALQALGKPAAAAAELQQAVHLAPTPDALIRLAWLRAACEDPQVRRGTEAVALAEQACLLAGQPGADYLDTLAAAYAQAGRFTDAVAAAERARTLAGSQGQKELADEIELHLRFYRAGQAYHEGARPPTQE